MTNLDQDQKKERIKTNTRESTYGLYEVQELTLNAFKKGLFPLKPSQRKGLKI